MSSWALEEPMKTTLLAATFAMGITTATSQEIRYACLEEVTYLCSPEKLCERNNYRTRVTFSIYPDKKAGTQESCSPNQQLGNCPLTILNILSGNVEIGFEARGFLWGTSYIEVTAKKYAIVGFSVDVSSSQFGRCGTRGDVERWSR
jgi:hypothetical protein